MVKTLHTLAKTRTRYSIHSKSTNDCCLTPNVDSILIPSEIVSFCSLMMHFGGTEVTNLTKPFNGFRHYIIRVVEDLYPTWTCASTYCLY